MGASMQTLFQFLTLDDWSNISRVVAIELPWMMFLFIGYVILASFVVLSLLTGVMANHINAVREDEEKEEYRQHCTQLRKTRHELYKAFQNVAGSCELDIGLEEFEQIIVHARLSESLSILNVNLEGISVAELFDLVDINQDGRISWTDFRTAMSELRRVTPAQLMTLRNQVARIAADEEPDTPSDVQSEHLEAALDAIKGGISNTEETLDKLGTTLSQFRKHVNRFSGK